MYFCLVVSSFPKRNKIFTCNSMLLKLRKILLFKDKIAMTIPATKMNCYLNWMSFPDTPDTFPSALCTALHPLHCPLRPLCLFNTQFSHVSDSATPWTAACQASLSITSSWSLFKFTSIESVMPSSHLVLCHPLLFPSSIFPIIRVFSSESALHIRWPKY